MGGIFCALLCPGPNVPKMHCVCEREWECVSVELGSNALSDLIFSCSAEIAKGEWNRIRVKKSWQRHEPNKR